MRMSAERRRAAVLASSSAVLGGSSAMSWRHGHPVLGWCVLGLQLAMVVTAIVLMYRLRRRECMTSVTRDC